MLGLLVSPEDGVTIFLRNIGLPPNYTALQPRTPQFSYSLQYFMGHITRIREDRNACKVSLAELRRPNHRWKDNFKIDEVGWEGMDWTGTGGGLL
jgi:hypothetical protein